MIEIFQLFTRWVVYINYGAQCTHTSLDNPSTNFAHINRIIISSATFSVRVDKRGILPSTLFMIMDSVDLVSKPYS